MSTSPINLATLKSLHSAYGMQKTVQASSWKKGKDSVSGDSEVSPFEKALSKGVDKVNDLQIKAENAMESMVTGDVDDISEVAAAVSEADMALRFTVQVRDKLLDAYNQLIRMSV